MKIENIKKSMMDYTDMFGRSLLDHSKIQSATTKEELSEIIETHHDHIGDSANDAQNSLLRYKQSLGLNEKLTK